jgi:hypothetical protein
VKGTKLAGAHLQLFDAATATTKSMGDLKTAITELKSPDLRRDLALKNQKLFLDGLKDARGVIVDIGCKNL